MNGPCCRCLSGLLAFALLISIAASPVAGAGDDQAPPKTKKEPGAEAKDNGQNGKEAAQEPAALAVPDGTPQELLDFIDKTMRQRGAPQDVKGFVAFEKKRGKAIEEAVEKILAAEPTEEQASRAIRLKVMVLQRLSQLQDKDAAKKLEAVPEELTKAGRPKLAREVRGILLAGKARQVRNAQSEEFQTLLEGIRKHLSEAPIGPNDLSLVMTVPRVAEYSNNRKLAGELYTEFAKLLAASQDERIASFATKLEGAARRMGLLKNTMRIEGMMLDGTMFDWSGYRGKVVLVDFWATWCGPCVAELPSIKKAYEAYHDRGFDIVALSLDSDLNDLENFVQKREIPWAVLLDRPELVVQKLRKADKEGKEPAEPEEPAQEAKSDSMADYYGVMAIPTTILVGKDGKVTSLSARGASLGKQLEELLGPAEQPKPDAEEESDTEGPGAKTSGETE